MALNSLAQYFVTFDFRGTAISPINPNLFATHTDVQTRI